MTDLIDLDVGYEARNVHDWDMSGDIVRTPHNEMNIYKLTGDPLMDTPLQPSRIDHEDSASGLHFTPLDGAYGPLKERVLARKQINEDLFGARDDATQSLFFRGGNHTPLQIGTAGREGSAGGLQSTPLNAVYRPLEERLLGRRLMYQDFPGTREAAVSSSSSMFFRGGSHTVNTTTKYCNSQATLGARPKLSSIGGKPITSIGPMDLGTEQTDTGEDRNIAAVRDACNYATMVIKNFTNRKDSLDTDARLCVDNMNDEIKLFLRQTGRPVETNVRLAEDRSALPRVDTAERRVRFGDQDYMAENTGSEPVRPAGPSYDEEPNPNSWRQSRRSRDSLYPRADHRVEALLPAEQPMSMGLLLKALENLSTHKVVPKPKAYSGSSGKAFECFLDRFEEYAADHFSGRPDLWAGELGPFLQGEMKDVYEDFIDAETGYTSLKSRLLAWSKSREEAVLKESKYKFSSAQMSHAESVGRYALRLERLFREAYPARTIEFSTSLRDKFVDTVPTQFQTQLKTIMSVQKTLNNAEMGWSALVDMACAEAGARNAWAEEEIWTTIDAQESPRSRAYQTRDSHRGRSVTNSQHRARSRNPEESGGGSSRHGTPPQRNRSSSRPREDRACSYCDIVGHLRRDCRRLHNLCLLCGAPEHRIADCPFRVQDGQPGGPPRMSQPNSVGLGTGGTGRSNERNDDNSRSRGN